MDRLAFHGYVSVQGVNPHVALFLHHTFWVHAIVVGVRVQPAVPKYGARFAASTQKAIVLVQVSLLGES